MTPDQEQAAQMRTAVWLEARSDAGKYKTVNPPPGAKCVTWCHPAAQLEASGLHLPKRQPKRRHRAIPRTVLIVAWDGWDPTDRTTYDDLVSMWRLLVEGVVIQWH